MSLDRKSDPSKMRPKCIAEARLLKSLRETRKRVFIIFEIIQDPLVFLPRNKFQLAKLHRLETARGI